jgi:hypothetical protein
VSFGSGFLVQVLLDPALSEHPHCLLEHDRQLRVSGELPAPRRSRGSAQCVQLALWVSQIYFGPLFVAAAQRLSGTPTLLLSKVHSLSLASPAEPSIEYWPG